MKQTLRKILAILVVLSIVLSVGIVALSGSATTPILFSEDFEDTLKVEDGWASAKTVENGKFKGGSVLLSNHSVINAMSDYTVEVEVRIDISGTSPIDGNVAGVVGRYITASGKKGGYEVCLGYKKSTQKTYMRVYDRFNNSQLANFSVQVDINQAHKITAVFAGTELKVFLNGTPMRTVTVEDRAGIVGVDTQGGFPAYYDNFTVRQADSGNEVSSAPTSTPVSSTPVTSTPASSTTSSGSGQSVYFQEDFEDTLKTSDGWASAKTVENGKFKGGSVLLSNHSVIKAMSDYAVEAEVRIDTTATTTIDGNVAGVVGRYTTGGYEVCLGCNKKGQGTYIRVYDRVGKAQVARFSVQADTTQAHKLTAVFTGTQVKVFLNGNYVGVATVADRAGTVGVTGSGFPAYYDNFTVRQATQAELDATVSSAPTSSAPVSSTPVSSTPVSSTPVTSTPASSSTSSGSGQSFPFFEDFEDTLKTSDGWNSAASVTDGKYKGWGVLLTNHSAIKAMSDYAVEAEVRIDTTATTTIDGNVAGVVGRYTTGGYEVCLGCNKKGQGTFIRIYDRVGKAQVARFSVQADTTQTHKLTAVFTGTQVKVFLNGNYVGVATVADRAGTVGITTSGFPAYYDNFTVRQATQAELDATVSSAPTSSTPVSSAPASSAPASGNYVFPFFEDFEDTLKIADGWNSAAAVQNGKFAGASAYLTNHTVLKAMSDYVVEATILVDIEAPTTISGNVSAIVGRYTSVNGVTGGYEVGYGVNRDTKATYIRVYDRAKKSQVAQVNMALINGQAYKITAVFAGTKLLVYVDGQLVRKMDVEERTGTAGMVRAGGYIAYYDNFTVRPATDDEINPPAVAAPEADANGVYYKDSFGSREDQTNGLWSQEFQTIRQGQAILSTQQGTNYITQDKSFYELTDYTVEAKLSFVDGAPVHISAPSVTLAGRATSSSDGYEFSLVVNSGKVRLRMYDRKNKVNIAENGTLQLEKGTQYTMRLVMIGNIIRAYLDDVKVFEFESDLFAKGTAGVRVAGTEGTIDDFVVRQPTQAERLGLSGGATGTGPSTGGNDTNPGTGDSILYVCAALCCLVAAAVVLMRRIKHIQG